jgi:hypothetical protein
MDYGFLLREGKSTTRHDGRLQPRPTGPGYYRTYQHRGSRWTCIRGDRDIGDSDHGCSHIISTANADTSEPNNKKKEGLARCLWGLVALLERA